MSGATLYTDGKIQERVHQLKAPSAVTSRCRRLPTLSRRCLVGHLDDLAQCIIDTFDFGGDHLYGFRLAARDGHQIRIEDPYIDDAKTHTDEIAISELPLNERQSTQFLYDSGRRLAIRRAPGKD